MVNIYMEKKTNYEYYQQYLLFRSRGGWCICCYDPGCKRVYVKSYIISKQLENIFCFK